MAVKFIWDDTDLPRENPNPILNMGVEIKPEWAEDFWKLAEVLKMSHKDTINWIVNAFFRETNGGKL